MSFSSPQALWLLALALPLVALFLVRPRAVVAEVGSLLLWKRVEARRAARARIARLEKVLSLVVHLAALAAIVLALAGPGGSARAPRRIVAILDASASMSARLGSGTRFGAALERARSLALSLEGNDELGFVVAGAVPRVLLAPAPRASRPELALSRAELEGGATDLREALELAYALLSDSSAGGFAREAWLLSDGACPDLEREPRPRPPEGVRLVFAREGSPDDWSVGVVAFGARELPDSPGEVEVHAALASSCPRPVKTRATILVGDAGDARKMTESEPVVVLDSIEIGPHATVSLPPRRVSLPRGGRLGIRIETPGDALAQDDEAWAVVPGSRATRVFLGEGEAEAASAPFIRAALEADARVELVPSSGEADVVVLVLGEDGTAREPPWSASSRGLLLVGPRALEAASGSR
ncbi:VWA domain-containing protein, partial [bacterium]|nr:VWA domain-containing protein [bacterium]